LEDRAMLINGYSHKAADLNPRRARWWHKWLFAGVALVTADAVIGLARLLR
jgi:hypothetical protein